MIDQHDTETYLALAGLIWLSHSHLSAAEKSSTYATLLEEPLLSAV